jgi:hypothetical protein
MRASDVITEARGQLKDTFTGSYRWSDTEMMDFTTEASIETSRRCPHSLFLAAPPTTLDITPVKTLAQQLQINDFYKESLVFLVCARALDRDSDDTTNAALAEEYRKRAYRYMGR